MATQISTSDEKARRGDIFFVKPADIILGTNGRTDEVSEEQIEVLANDMDANGQLQPVVCRRIEGKKLELVLGYCRHRAAMKLAAKNPDWRLKVVVQDMSDKEAFLANIRENRLRNTVTPIDTASNMRRLAEGFGMVRKEIAECYQISPQNVGRYLELLNLPEAIRKRVSSGDLAMNAALKLLQLPAQKAVEVVEAATVTVEVPDTTPVLPVAAGGDGANEATAPAPAGRYAGRRVTVGGDPGTVASEDGDLLMIDFDAGGSTSRHVDDADLVILATQIPDTMPKVFPVPAPLPAPQDGTGAPGNGQPKPPRTKTKIDGAKLAEESRKAGLKVNRSVGDLRKLIGSRKDPLCVAILGYLDGLLDEDAVNEAIASTYPEHEPALSA